MAKTDPRIIKTKRQIDQALLDCLSHYPFSKITIDMICKSAMINRSTFYKYYVDKFDLLDKFLSRVLSDFKENAVVDFILATPANVGSSVYTELFGRFAQYLYTNRETFKTLWNAPLDRPIYDEMVLIIQNRIKDLLSGCSQDGVKNIYVDLYSYIFASNAMSLITWWFENERSVTLQEVISIMTKSMEDGLFKTFKDYFT